MEGNRTLDVNTKDVWPETPLIASMRKPRINHTIVRQRETVSIKGKDNSVVPAEKFSNLRMDISETVKEAIEKEKLGVTLLSDNVAKGGSRSQRMIGIQAMQESRKFRHDAAIKSFELRQRELYDVLADKLLKTSEQFKETIREIDHSEAQLFSATEDPSVGGLQDQTWLEKQRSTLENLEFSRSQAVSHFSTEADNLENYRCEEIGDQLRTLASTLSDIGHILDPEIHRTIENYTTELNLLVVNNRKEHVNTVALLELSISNSRKKAYQRWSETEKKWRGIKHQAAVKAFVDKLNSSETVNPANRRIIIDHLIETLQVRHHNERLPLVLDRLLKLRPPDFTTENIDAISSQLDALIETDKQELESFVKGIETVNVENTGQSRAALEELRIHLHTFEYLSPEGKLPSLAEELQEEVDDPYIQDLFQRASGLKLELTSVANSCVQSEVIYDTPLTAVQARLILLVDSIELGPMTQRCGRNAERQSLLDVLDKLRTAKRSEIPNLVVRLHHLLDSIHRIPGISSTVQMELESIIEDLGDTIEAIHDALVRSNLDVPISVQKFLFPERFGESDGGSASGTRNDSATMAGHSDNLSSNGRSVSGRTQGNPLGRSARNTARSVHRSVKRDAATVFTGMDGRSTTPRQKQDGKSVAGKSHFRSSTTIRSNRSKRQGTRSVRTSLRSEMSDALSSIMGAVLPLPVIRSLQRRVAIVVGASDLPESIQDVLRRMLEACEVQKKANANIDSELSKTCAPLVYKRELQGLGLVARIRNNVTQQITRLSDAGTTLCTYLSELATLITTDAAAHITADNDIATALQDAEEEFESLNQEKEAEIEHHMKLVRESPNFDELRARKQYALGLLAKLEQSYKTHAEVCIKWSKVHSKRVQALFRYHRKALAHLLGLFLPNEASIALDGEPLPGETKLNDIRWTIDGPIVASNHREGRSKRIKATQRETSALDVLRSVVAMEAGKEIYKRSQNLDLTYVDDLDVEKLHITSVPDPNIDIGYIPLEEMNLGGTIVPSERTSRDAEYAVEIPIPTLAAYLSDPSIAMSVEKDALIQKKRRDVELAHIAAKEAEEQRQRELEAQENAAGKGKDKKRAASAPRMTPNVAETKSKKGGGASLKQVPNPVAPASSLPDYSHFEADGPDEADLNASRRSSIGSQYDLMGNNGFMDEKLAQNQNALAGDLESDYAKGFYAKHGIPLDIMGNPCSPHLCIPHDEFARAMADLRFDLLSQLQQYYIERSWVVNQLVTSRCAAAAALLEERLRKHAPREGLMEVEVYLIRESEIIAHLQKFERCKIRLQECDAIGLEDYESNFHDIQSARKNTLHKLDLLKEAIPNQVTLATLQGLSLKARQLRASAQFEMRALLDKCISNIENTAKNASNVAKEFLTSCILFSADGDYDDEEVQEYHAIMDNICNDVEAACQERIQNVQEFRNSIESDDDLWNRFHEMVEKAMQTMSLKDGLGPKFGVPRRIASESIRASIHASEEGASTIDRRLDELESLISQSRETIDALNRLVDETNVFTFLPSSERHLEDLSVTKTNQALDTISCLNLVPGLGLSLSTLVQPQIPPPVPPGLSAIDEEVAILRESRHLHDFDISELTKKAASKSPLDTPSITPTGTGEATRSTKGGKPPLNKGASRRILSAASIRSDGSQSASEPISSSSNTRNNTSFPNAAGYSETAAAEAQRLAEEGKRREVDEEVIHRLGIAPISVRIRRVVSVLRDSLYSRAILLDALRKKEDWNGAPRSFFLPFISLADGPPGAFLELCGFSTGSNNIYSFQRKKIAFYTIPKVYPVIGHPTPLVLPPMQLDTTNSVPTNESASSRATTPNKSRSTRERSNSVQLEPESLLKSKNSVISHNVIPNKKPLPLLTGNEYLSQSFEECVKTVMDPMAPHTIVGKSPGIVIHNAANSLRLMVAIETAIERCKDDTRKQWIEEGQPLPEGDENLPEALKKWIREQEKRSIDLRDFSSRRLREQCMRAHALLRDAGISLVADVAARSIMNCHLEIEQSLNTYRKLAAELEAERLRNVDKLKMRLSDPNARQELEALHAEEEQRIQRLLDEVENQRHIAIEAVHLHAQLFSMRLLHSTALFLLTAQEVLLPEDLSPLAGDEFIVPKKMSLKRLSKTLRKAGSVSSDIVSIALGHKPLADVSNEVVSGQDISAFAKPFSRDQLTSNADANTVQNTEQKVALSRTGKISQENRKSGTADVTDRRKSIVSRKGLNSSGQNVDEQHVQPTALRAVKDVYATRVWRGLPLLGITKASLKIQDYTLVSSPFLALHGDECILGREEFSQQTLLQKPTDMPVFYGQLLCMYNSTSRHTIRARNLYYLLFHAHVFAASAEIHAMFDRVVLEVEKWSDAWLRKINTMRRSSDPSLLELLSSSKQVIDRLKMDAKEREESQQKAEEELNIHLEKEVKSKSLVKKAKK